MDKSGIASVWIQCFTVLQKSYKLDQITGQRKSIHTQMRPYNYLMHHDDDTKWKHFPRSCLFVWGIHQSPANFPDKGHWSGALMFLWTDKRLSKQWIRRLIETPSCSLCRHCNVTLSTSVLLDIWCHYYMIYEYRSICRECDFAYNQSAWQWLLKPLHCHKIFVWISPVTKYKMIINPYPWYETTVNHLNVDQALAFLWRKYAPPYLIV